MLISFASYYGVLRRYMLLRTFSRPEQRYPTFVNLMYLVTQVLAQMALSRTYRIHQAKGGVTL